MSKGPATESKGAVFLRGLSGWARRVVGKSGGNPETINDSEHSAPSKRLSSKARYIKTIHGSDIADEIGLDVLREKCRGFEKWLSGLEKLEAQFYYIQFRVTGRSRSGSKMAMLWMSIIWITIKQSICD